ECRAQKEAGVADEDILRRGIGGAQGAPELPPPCPWDRKVGNQLEDRIANDHVARASGLDRGTLSREPGCEHRDLLDSARSQQHLIEVAHVALQSTDVRREVRAEDEQPQLAHHQYRRPSIDERASWPTSIPGMIGAMS